MVRQEDGFRAVKFFGRLPAAAVRSGINLFFTDQADGFCGGGDCAGCGRRGRRPGQARPWLDLWGVRGESIFGEGEKCSGRLTTSGACERFDTIPE